MAKHVSKYGNNPERAAARESLVELQKNPEGHPLYWGLSFFDEVASTSPYRHLRIIRWNQGVLRMEEK